MSSAAASPADALPDDIEQIVMRRPVEGVRPCEIRFARVGPNIVARFYDAGGDQAGQTTHPGAWSVSDFIDHYWPRGWEVVRSSAGRYEHPTNDPQPPVGTMPTGPHAEAEAAAIQSAHSGAELIGYVARSEGAAGDGSPGRYTGRGLVMFGSILTADQREVTPDPPPVGSGPGENRRDAHWPTPPPSYGNTSTGRVLAEIDTLIGDSLGQRNQVLRRQLRDAKAEAVQERALRQDAQARLVQAEADLAAARERIAELDLTVRTLGEVIRHAAGHDKGGESDG